MFKWIKRKWKDRKKSQTVTPRRQATRAELLGMLDVDHVYEEIAEPDKNEPRSSINLGLTRQHMNLQLQRSISFHDILRPGTIYPAENRHPTRNGWCHSSEMLPTIPCSSISSSLNNTPTNSCGNLHAGDVTFQLLPENHQGKLSQRDPNFRTMPLHSNIFLPRKSATFASADTEMCRKRVKFQKQSDADMIYSTTGSDSGYGFSNNNSTGSDESDTTPRGNYDAYVSKMEELLRLEKEVRNILKTIRGEDEPDDGYQNSRYFQDDPRFADIEFAAKKSTAIRSSNSLSHRTSNGLVPTQCPDNNTQHLPLRRVSDKSITPEVSRRAVKPVPMSSRVHSPLPPTPGGNGGRVAGQARTHPPREQATSTAGASRSLITDTYLIPTSGHLATSAGRCRTPTNDGFLPTDPNRAERSTALNSRKVKQIAPRIQDKCHLPMSLHTNTSLSRATGMSVPKETVCLECSKRCAASPRLRQRCITPAPQWNTLVDDYSNNVTNH